MARNVGSTRGYKKKADDLFSKIIRSHGQCVACGSTSNLQTMHIISRRFSHTRTDLENALCGCATCHHRFTDYPVEFGQFVEATIGNTLYAQLVLRSQSTGKVDWREEADRLGTIWKEIQATKA